MFVLGELKKSIKFLEDMASELEKIDNITDIDAYELRAQKVVFNLQMQANQVAGELVPKIMNRRAELQTANAQSALERIRAKRQELQEKIESGNTIDEPKQEEIPEEPKVEDDGNSNRQQHSKAGNGKSKSSSKTK